MADGPREYVVKLTITLHVEGQVTIEAQDEVYAEFSVQDMIDNHVFGFGSWTLKQETDDAGFQFENEEQSIEVESVEEA